MIITCKADAFPEPNYTITRNGNYVPDVVDGVKTIQSANITDDGRYECVAKNSVGSVSASFNLTVNGKICVEPVLVLISWKAITMKIKIKKLFCFWKSKNDVCPGAHCMAPNFHNIRRI